MQSDPRLDAVIDRLAVTDVVSTYVDRVDALDVDGLRALFAPDATVDLLGTTKQGADAISRHLGRALSGFEATSHHLTGPLVTVDGDRAHVSAGVYAWHARRGGDWWHFHGRYDFDLARAGAGWLITHERLVGIGGGPDAHPAERGLYTGHPDRHAPGQERA